MTRAAGLDVGGTELKVVVLDGEEPTVRERHRLPNGSVLDFVVDVARKVVADHGAVSLGVGLAGLVRHPAGAFVWGPHLEGSAVPYRSVLSEALGFDVVVDNDANLAAYAEWSLGAGERADPLVMVTLGTGIGLGMIIGGVIYRGRSFAGEAGHMPVLPGGEPCPCGRHGCWETVISGRRFDQLAAEAVRVDATGAVARLAGDGVPSGAHLVTAALEGDHRAAAVIGDAGRWLGRGLATLVLVLDPARVVIGGAAAAAGDLLLTPAREALAEWMAGADVRPAVSVVPARHGTFAGAMGGALAGRTGQNGGRER